MLYQLYEAQRSLMEPFADFALASSKMLGNPVSPLAQNPLVQRLSASYDLMYRLCKDYVKPEFGIPFVDINGSEVAIREVIEVNKPFCDLLHFKTFCDTPFMKSRA